MEIKVGNFIRTKDGVIAKVTYVDAMMVDCDRDVFDLNNLAMMEIPTEYIEEYIVKHTKNIIDIIECGDYVNGSRILDITVDYINATEWNCCKSRLEKTIKSIVTKEMFKSVEYRVE